MRAFLELTKPGVTWLVVMSTGAGFLAGCQGRWSWWVLLHVLAGTGLMASGTAVLNQWMEQEVDALMRRTCRRPLPSGRVTSPAAFCWGLMLSAAGFVQLWLGAGQLPALLGLATLLIYLLAYTPLKRHTPHATTVGALPGAIPPLMGYAAASGQLDGQAFLWAAILFLWQFPHFYSIAWLYRDDYRRAGIRMKPVVDPDLRSTARWILASSVLLLVVSLLPFWLSGFRSLYVTGATIAGLWMLRASFQAWKAPKGQSARRVLIASVVYLPVLYAVMVLDRLWLW